MEAEKLARAYLNLRDARAKAKAEFDRIDEDLKAKQGMIQSVMLNFMNTTGVKSVRVEGATFYREQDVMPAGSDWEAFYDWIVEHRAFDALERRIKKTFVKSYMEDNKGAIPPGVTVHKAWVVKVRKSNKSDGSDNQDEE